jgi:hypothetical protein
MPPHSAASVPPLSRRVLGCNPDRDYRATARELSEGYKKVMMTHEYCRSMYLVMLNDFPLEWIAEFWNAHPLVLPGRKLEGPALLRFLWDRKGQVPVHWDCEVANAVEPFVVSKDLVGFDFTKRMLYRNNSGSYIPGRKILSWFYPVMSTAFSVLDGRDMVFKLCTVYSERIWQGHLHRRVKRVELGGWIESWMAYIPDRTFRDRIEFNFDYLAGDQIQSAPKVFRLPAFEEISYMADLRTPERVLWTGCAEMRGDALYIDGERYGHATTFHGFTASNGLDLGEFSPPDGEVILMEKEYRCPERRRAVLHAGCAYGAPLYLTRIRHRKTPDKASNLLGDLIADSELEEEDLFESELRKRHLELVGRMEAKAVFAYDAGTQSMSLNGKHFLKNVPAVILQRILIAYTTGGKHEFEYREFKNDFEISLGQKNANFEIRFYRLLEKLERAGAGLSIRRLERGRFAIKADVRIEYREEA